MGMHILGAKRRGEPDIIIDINTTPLIDVMLVLLVMLIITIPIQLHSVNLHLPVGQPPSASVKPEVLKIDVDARNVIYLNGAPVAGGRTELLSRLHEAAAQPVQPEVHLRADRHAKYNTFAEVMVAVNQVGLAKVGVVGSEQFMTQ